MRPPIIIKVAVYTIAKNEAVNVPGFMASCSEADMVCVLDTGSTDGTPDLLRQHEAVVNETRIEPWRFNDARNLALSHVPPDVDICVSLDLDERLQPGWRSALEQMWSRDHGLISCRTIVSWSDEGQTVPGVVAYLPRIHARHGYIWSGPVHETIRSINGDTSAKLCSDNIVIHHYPIGVRSYTDLLDDLIQQEPSNTTARLQRAAGLAGAGKWMAALENYEAFLDLTRHNLERSIKHRRMLAWLEIARCRQWLKLPITEVIQALLFAVAEDHQAREPWVYLADAWTSIGNWPAAYGAAMSALGITQRGPTSEEICWGSLPQQIANDAFARIMQGGVEQYAGSIRSH